MDSSEGDESSAFQFGFLNRPKTGSFGIACEVVLTVLHFLLTENAPLKMALTGTVQGSSDYKYKTDKQLFSIKRQ